LKIHSALRILLHAMKKAIKPEKGERSP
jgi:hypothetical protein